MPPTGGEGGAGMHPELLVRKRMMLLTLVLLVLFGLVLLRVGRLTTVQSEELTQRGVNQWTKAGTVTARRGKIVDRNGNVLVVSARRTVSVPIRVLFPMRNFFWIPLRPCFPWTGKQR